MVFYNELFKYYDYIYPIDPIILKFLMNHIKSNNKILNAACGSGEYCIGLTRNNYDVTGIDFHENIINIAINEAKKLNLKIDFQACNLLSLNKTFNNDEFSSIICIKNSLSYLNSLDEVYTVLKNFYNLLQTRGNLILQFINYNKLLNYNANEFSTTIKNNRLGIEFTKRYEVYSDKILFSSILKDNDVKLFDNTTNLLTLNYNDLNNILNDIGFKQIRIFGDFTGCVFNENQSNKVVFTCKK